jgi:hypothetical protein
MKTILTISKVITISLFFFVFGCTSSSDNNPIVTGTNPIFVNKTETPAVTAATAAAIISVSAAPTAINVNSTNPCIGAPAPAKWNHVVVLMFENHDSAIGSPSMPYITSLAHKCATSDNWTDADFHVDGTPDGEYNSKPSYATLTNGLSPTVHGLIDDTYESKTKVESIYDQLNKAGKSFKDYYDAEAGGCSVDFNGAYHDPIRYYTSMTSICDEHDVPLSTFMTDLNSGNLPVYSMIIPSNDHNQHDNSLESGDAWAKSFVEPILNSAAYQKGDVAFFFLWDEDSPVPNVLISPSIVPGSKVPVPSGNPISHFSALRTWEEMLDLPLLGNTNLAPSLLTFFDGS